MQGQNDLEKAFSMVEQQNNQTIKAGESILARLRSNIDYPILLLSHMSQTSHYVGQLRAAIQLRIWCQNYKNLEQFERNSYNNIIQQVKSNILFAFLSFKDKKIEQTILPGIVSLTAVEFPDKWSSLIPGLITYAKDNSNSINKILELMVEITNKYSYLTRSDPLYHQIIIVCNEFQRFLLQLTSHSVSNILQTQSDPQKLRMLELQINMFYNLNYQDLHPQFEDNLPQWMNILKQVMHLPDNNQKFFKCKGVALQSILLYASKYKDDVEQQIKGFSQSIWTLCANASPDPEYDDIVFNALKYFRSLLMWPDMKQFFTNNIPNLISNLILPNLSFSITYKDLFQDDIDTFISYFFRNAQISSRRAAAIELLQTIVRNYKNFQQFLQEQLKGFTPNNDNVQGQYLLLTLVIQSAARGFRDIDGVTQLQINNNIIIYCYEQFIKNSLNLIYQSCENNSGKPIQKQMNILQLLITLRFIFYFRIFLPTEQMSLLLKLCCKMTTNSDSLKQILLLVVNAIVTLKHGNFQIYKNLVNYYDEQKLKQVAPDILNMIGAYQSQTTQLSASINKLLYSVVKQLKGFNQTFYDSHIQRLIKSMLSKTASYNFNNILPLFEAIGYLAYYLCQMKSQKCADLQNITHQFFQQMIKQSSDLLNFCFQILSIFLQLNPGNRSFYENLYLSIIRQQNWTQDNTSLMSSYLQYIAAYIALNNDKIISDKQAYEKILTKLITIDHYELFYRLLKNIIKITGVQDFYKYGYMNILIRGTDYISKSTQGRKNGLLFIFEMTYDYNTATAIKCMNQVENGSYQRILLSNQDIIQTMQALNNKKMMFSSICNALVQRCISSVQNQALIINLLVQNTISRFKRDIINNMITQNVNKKESTYQKLLVFKEMQNTSRSISLDEQAVLIQAYKILANQDPSIKDMITQKNMERLQKLYNKQRNQNNYQSGFQNQNNFKFGN